MLAMSEQTPAGSCCCPLRLPTLLTHLATSPHTHCPPTHTLHYPTAPTAPPLHCPPCTAEVVWTQEEPMNMGAYLHVQPRLQRCMEVRGRLVGGRGRRGGALGRVWMRRAVRVPFGFRP